MRLIIRRDQQRIFRGIVEIVKVLAKNDESEAADAIVDAYRIAGIVGGDEMVRALGGGMNIRKLSKAIMDKRKKADLIEYIRLLEYHLEEETKRKYVQN